LACLYELHDLAGLCVTVELGFFKNWHAVRDDFESPAS